MNHFIQLRRGVDTRMGSKNGDSAGSEQEQAQEEYQRALQERRDRDNQGKQNGEKK